MNFLMQGIIDKIMDINTNVNNEATTIRINLKSWKTDYFFKDVYLPVIKLSSVKDSSYKF